jgi:hypothetical protein
LQLHSAALVLLGPSNPAENGRSPSKLTRFDAAEPITTPTNRMVRRCGVTGPALAKLRAIEMALHVLAYNMKRLGPN